MSSSASSIAARARLLLRAERVMGLPQVRVRDASRLARRPAGGADAAARASGSERAAPAPQAVAAARRAPSLGAAPTSSARPAPPATRSTPPPAAVAASIPALLELPPITGPVLPRHEKFELLQALDAQHVRGCTKCRLCETRTQTVFGEGDVDAAILFVGEGPGENEDLQGRPFVGRAGELLDKQIAAMGLKREQVFIANVVKCRPPNNRTPMNDEVAACTPYLVQQIETIRPKVIVTLGLPATKYILQKNETMSRMRGVWHEYRGIRVMPTYHPAYLLRAYTAANRAAVWSDLQKVMEQVGLPVPGRRGGSEGAKNP